MNKNWIPQKWRFVFLLVEAGVLLVANRVGFGSWLPSTDPAGWWFYSAFLGLLFGKRLDTPFFAKPVDVILYALPSLIAILQSGAGLFSAWGDIEKSLFIGAVSFSGFVAFAAGAAVWGKPEKGMESKAWATTAKLTAESIGAPKVFFSVLFFLVLVAFNRSSAQQLLATFIAWACTVAFSPLDGAYRWFSQIAASLLGRKTVSEVGEVAAYQTPGIVLIRQAAGDATAFGDVLVINDPLGKPRVTLSLDHVGRDEGLLLRIVDVPDAKVSADLATRLRQLPPNSAIRVDEPDEAVAQNRLVKAKDALVGLVAPDTSVERLFFEVVKEEGLEEGRLVEVQIGKRVVTYQLVNGLTKEEVVQHKNTHGFARAQAQKIGEWDALSKRFSFVKWLPAPNAPVFLKSTADFVASSNAVGHFPGTNYPVSIKSIDELATHNTAILGILGVGKSMLAIELVERMMASGIKVICLDLTNQYSQELAAYYDAAHEEACLAKIQEAGEKDREAWADNPEEGGSIPALREAFHADLFEFLADDNTRRLKIYNPSQVVGSKQLSEPKQFQTQGKWQRGAALWGVTPVEVTRMVSETALALLQDQMSSKARVCLVYEEAHSLIPEFSAVASPSDREASNGTARAILQGRKFGLGCLVVTQRTANVTKTILNQCNTVFAMRTFDETGKEFLANYIGKEYAASLSSISERHAVLFGKASSCENPILIRLNDREEFRQVFRAENAPPPIPPPHVAPAAAAPAATTVETSHDDIPF